jgi:hypothetical protein
MKTIASVADLHRDYRPAHCGPLRLTSEAGPPEDDMLCGLQSFYRAAKAADYEVYRPEFATKAAVLLNARTK